MTGAVTSQQWTAVANSTETNTKYPDQQSLILSPFHLGRYRTTHEYYIVAFAPETKRRQLLMAVTIYYAQIQNKAHLQFHCKGLTVGLVIAFTYRSANRLRWLHCCGRWPHQACDSRPNGQGGSP